MWSRSGLRCLARASGAERGPSWRPSWLSGGFFLYGFGKNERANIDQDELKVFREMAKELLGFDDRQLATALMAGEIVEVCHGNDEA